MRALLHVDVVTAARALLSFPAAKRRAVCDRLFDTAQAADKYRKRYGRYHRQFGSGSLASACWNLDLNPEPFLSDREYAHCMKVVFERVLNGTITQMHM
jgi:hypothetical protein